MWAPVLFLNAPLAAIPLGAGGDNTLSNLTIAGGGTLAPAFASATITYAASVASGVQSILVTPTSTHVDAVVSINGRLARSGIPVVVNLPVGSFAIAVVCNGGAADKTYTITVTKAAGSILPPNPNNPVFNFIPNPFISFPASRSVTMSNANASDMTISFPSWNSTNHSWVTTFPLVIPANSSVQVTVTAAAPVMPPPGQPRPSFYLGGTWSCGAESGIMEATVLR